MPAPAHLVDSLGRCGVSFVVIAFYVLVTVATIVGLVGPTTLVTWPDGGVIRDLQPCSGDAKVCNIQHKITITGLATYNQLVAVMARVDLPKAAIDGSGPSMTLSGDVGYEQTYNLVAVGLGASAPTQLSNRSHHSYLEFDVGHSSSPSFLLAYYPQCVR